ncbi:MAG: hypothetical protein ABIQ93_15820, partial [Saprospiraceae bacterium]
MRPMILLACCVFAATSFAQMTKPVTAPVMPMPEKHLRNIRQMTFGGDNAEAYWSPNSKWLTFQSNNPRWGLHCDQIFAMQVKKAANDSTYKFPRISNGKGRTTCSYFMPDGKHILYASTHAAADTCPPTGDLHKGGKYLWPVYP